MKRLIAFSSVAHMGFVMLGIATLTDVGINAAIFGMVAHGLITGMLFFLAGSVQQQLRHARSPARRAADPGAEDGLDPRRSARWRASVCPGSPGSGASSRRSCRSTIPGWGCRSGVPRLHGRRRHRDGARRRLPPVDAPEGRVRHAEDRVRDAHIHDVHWPEWTPGRRCCCSSSRSACTRTSSSASPTASVERRRGHGEGASG